ncbi:hypothetical protein MTR67_034289 [Solanum verrucosum]|uniref:C2 DOCK-type domain-containing protein n=1 Tax=Solanum verrucosum TaxID=315347 RepID=A0AAF0U8A9_SOLVR|nr:hypothetical protein MTR67_034289 [Solanum verrucosum]
MNGGHRELDENLEQWPHLNELVQCYRTDWVKDENKYGHYESVSPTSFQSQIYEGPDTDIETEMHLANARRSKIEDSIDGEIPSTSGTQLSEDNFSDLSNAKVSKHFGESPLPTYEPVFDWENERSLIIGQRIPEAHMSQYTSGLKIAVKVLSLSFQAGLVEPFYGTICLYNRERREKLSEDFIFHVLPTEMQEASSSYERRCIFHLDAPSASICLLIQLEKPATEEGGVSPSVYSRKEPVHLTEREKQKLQVWSRIMPYRESFSWAIIPLFDSNIASVGGSASPSSPLAPSVSASSSQEGITEPLSKITADGKLGYSNGNSIVVEVSNLNKVKEGYTEESLQDPKRKVHKPVKGVLKLEIEKLPASSTEVENALESGSLIYDSLDHGDHLNDSTSMKCPTNGSFSKSKSSEMKELVRNGSVTHENVENTADDFEAFDFRTTTRNEPFLQLFHCLYVYPLTVSMSRKRNMFIRVELRRDDTDIRKPSLEAMHPKEPGVPLQKWSHTQVAVGARVASYHDEIKVSLPVIWTPSHHLLFTFYHVDLQTKLEAPKPSYQSPVVPEVLAISYDLNPTAKGGDVRKEDNGALETGLGKVLGVDFQGHGEEALELLLQVDNSRHARRMEVEGVQENKIQRFPRFKKSSNFDVKLKNSGNRDMIFFAMGFKSYDIARDESRAEMWYDWTERRRIMISRASFSQKSMEWICSILKETSKNVFKAVGDFCRGWVKTEEETNLRNHLKWARILVKANGNSIPKEVKIAFEGIEYIIQVWDETPTRFFAGESAYDIGGDRRTQSSNQWLLQKAERKRVRPGPTGPTSFIYPVNEVPQISLLANILGGKIGELPTTYLGMPLGAKSKSLSIWNSVVEKCERKLVNWKSPYLSSGGRVTLINSVLDAMPTYMMSLFPMPGKIIQRLDTIRRNFVWQERGLRIKNLKAHNKSLLLKWLWRLATDDQSLWKDTIFARYGKEGSWTTKEVNTPYGVGLWRTIRNQWPGIWSNSVINVGNGRKTLFWNDIWMGQTPLRQQFPDIYILNQQKMAAIVEVKNEQGWNLIFRRFLNDLEMERLTQFYNTLEQAKNLTCEEDKLTWKLEKDGKFKVKSAYKLLYISTETKELWPWKMIWKGKIPHKVAYFTWLVARQSVLT